MIKDYFEKLKAVWTKTPEFYESILSRDNSSDAARFAALTGVLVALELGLVEAANKGSISMVAMVVGIMLVVAPFLTLTWVYLWSAFIRLCGMLLGEKLPLKPLQLVVSYSSAGLVTLGIGIFWGKWLALIVVFFQMLGTERALKCSRKTAAVYVMLPVSLVMILLGLFTIMFKVF